MQTHLTYQQYPEKFSQLSCLSGIFCRTHRETAFPCLNVLPDKKRHLGQYQGINQRDAEGRGGLVGLGMSLGGHSDAAG